jgi:transcriptional regulator with XRE-family HTH domain
MSSELRLGQVEPRERVGARTGRKYEYQYERTARAALNLLTDEPQWISVYCDWHDDYVVEIGAPSSRYVFNQVKGRKSSQGPWSFAEFFGVAKRKADKPSNKPSKVKMDAIFPRMLLHYIDFPNSCAGLAFVTNTGIEPPFFTFLDAIGKAATEVDLEGDAAFQFQHLANAYQSAQPRLIPSATNLFLWLKDLVVHTDQGHLEDPEAALLELGSVVGEYSEIDLIQRQAKQIAREIIGLVKDKVTHSSTKIPASDVQLRKDKGLVVAEILGFLSLSAPAYERLKAGETSDTVKTLSRLQRFCKDRNMADYITDICGYKAQWDIWRTIERHFLNSVDYLLLDQKAREVLKANLPIDKVIEESKDIAKQFSGLTVTPLTPERVLCFVFALAAQAEAVTARDLVQVQNGR